MTKLLDQTKSAGQNELKGHRVKDDLGASLCHGISIEDGMRNT